ncbi:3-deoxy-manno-octulosonate cytidylyltransferase [Alkalilimnicola ehrlichii MLHE-1]|uniref:3-deoxy-manno-octulosonate cytidylyltransferase n=1 Tax=Alkalilimnicola ehrlichii (strain ATCC BAA-1101 / DSM 17681 / MLHE-1) TaxID=187272 RepID=KDSB_ALKEH|nr:3-deoxy-manno-octulosonate cytidylyltransferase [Alkalilimnicola ehrlichii]Q0A8Q5.1 RecName: Full=3-deoxy-manno-octulosonate cytidylyltransferase; AltName: Full=CMP-2-keto-3-deoxyoctulosonic acid synthase; Short=CKS; Short=CMP-KDO synthase [Alkalilimnicola ehrlichii MLHE-1]ABI56782.1 3-deoxy-D-manno-octulosonate cytidylyltransferase [Alkalilimnicola ehrlichii MLHE-1]
MTTPFTVIIPARYASHRFPGKPLASLLGWPMIHHVCRRAEESGAARILVATDHREIAHACREEGREVVMTRHDHPSGTDRLAEVAERLGLDDDQIVVNLQGDEPLMPGRLVRQVALDLAAHRDAGIATLATLCHSLDEVRSPHAVKVVRDRQGYALYFSRAPIPWDRDGFSGAAGAARSPGQWLRHLGLYAYRVGFLRRYPALEAAPPEGLEALEQLRALWHGVRIHVGLAHQVPGPGVDTPQDLAQVERLLAEQGPPA